MVLVFKSKLGCVVSHDCEQMGHSYLTNTPSHLHFRVIDKVVYLVGGHSYWSGSSNKWKRGNYHRYDHRIVMGSVI